MYHIICFHVLNVYGCSFPVRIIYDLCKSLVTMCDWSLSVTIKCDLSLGVTRVCKSLCVTGSSVSVH